MFLSILIYTSILVVTNEFELYSESNVENRIVGGSPVTEKQFPWHAVVAVTKTNSIMLCGGSLINREWVLTSAQCIDGAEVFSIGIGKLNLDEYETDKLLVSTIGIKHEQYNNRTFQNDIGLIKLPKEVVFSDRINATRLPSRKYSFENLDDKNVFISGHGTNSSVLENIDISTDLISLEEKIISMDRCADYFGKEFISMNLLCAVSEEKTGPCFNDTGDPLIVIQSDGYATQVGIFSYFHEEGCDLGYPSVYTKVGRYIDWISTKTGIQIVEDNSSHSLYVSKFVIILLSILYIIY